MGRVALEDLSRDELLFLIQRLRQVVDVRDFEIETLERDLDAARKQLASVQTRSRPTPPPLVFKPRPELGSRATETRPG
ncbi:MAG: hypothetical protein JO023_25650 [Chloroflexi bacterium]|nr:hypothetical protein [Chloroflexota bacterium]